VNEFEFIDHIKSKYNLTRLGDDCAVLPKDGQTDQLITTDMLVEDIDFRLEWTTPEFLGHKALAVSLSDIAAMGGDPQWAILSIAVPERLWGPDFLNRFYEGWMALAREFSVELAGGDVSRAPDKLVIDTMVGGIVPKGKAILRSGARPGDGIYVTGTLGGASGALKLLENGAGPAKDADQTTRKLLLKQLKPAPQVDTGKLLRSLDVVTSMIDLSDGLSSDLGHICNQSGVGAEIDAELIPIDPLLRDRFPVHDALEMALNGGEDLELLFTTVREDLVAAAVDATRIGTISQGGPVFLCTDGQKIRLPARGYKHF
jgi:thiamine-monophosphate kinase